VSLGANSGSQPHCAAPSRTDRGRRDDPACADDQSFPWDRDRDVLRRPRAAHFHARASNGAAKVRIDTLEAIESTLARQHLRFVPAWAELHQDELLENWRLARAGETLQQIEPLR
jgi:hypothetical protein